MKMHRSDFLLGVIAVFLTLEEMKNYLRMEDQQEFEQSPNAKIAVQYAVAYQYERREEADHHALTLTLRALLFGERKPGF